MRNEQDFRSKICFHLITNCAAYKGTRIDEKEKVKKKNTFDRIDSVKLNRNSYVILLIKLLIHMHTNPTKCLYTSFVTSISMQTPWKSETLQMKISIGTGDNWNQNQAHIHSHIHTLISHISLNQDSTLFFYVMEIEIYLSYIK